VAGEIEASSLIDYVDQTPTGKAFLYSDEGMIFEAYLMASNSRHMELQSAMEPYKKNSENNEISEEERKKAAKIFDMFGYIIRRKDYGLLNYLSKKIEISDQFSTD